MARAETRTETVYVVPSTETRYVLTLSEEEASLLLDVLNQIDGDLFTSRRDLAASILEALVSVETPRGVMKYDVDSDYEGAIYFR